MSLPIWTIGGDGGASLTLASMRTPVRVAGRGRRGAMGAGLRDSQRKQRSPDLPGVGASDSPQSCRAVCPGTVPMAVPPVRHVFALALVEVNVVPARGRPRRRIAASTACPPAGKPGLRGIERTAISGVKIADEAGQPGRPGRPVLFPVPVDGQQEEIVGGPRAELEEEMSSLNAASNAAR